MLLGLTSLALVDEHDGKYSNAALIDSFFERGEWEVVSDLVRFHGEIVYLAEADLLKSLKTDSNVGLQRVPGQGRSLYERLAETPRLQTVFYKYMHSWSTLAIPLLLDGFDFSRCKQVADICGGDATNAIAIAKACEEVRVTLVELPANAPLARQRIEEAALTERITVVEADVFASEFPRDHDCFIFIHAFVIWSMDVVRILLEKAYKALPVGGWVVFLVRLARMMVKGH